MFVSDGIDLSVMTWGVREDIVEVETPLPYTLQLLLVLVGDSSKLIDITSLDTTHFKLRFFLSMDRDYSDNDVTVPLELTSTQTAELQVS